MKTALTVAKKRLKKFLFTLKIWKIGIGAGFILLAFILLIIKVVTSSTGLVNWQLLSLYFMLILVLTVSRMTRFTTVGLRFSYFLLFFITITLGPVTAVVLRILSLPMRIGFYLVDVPLKSFFRSKEHKIGRQVMYSGVSIGIMAAAVKAIGLSVVLSNLTLYYLILYGSWLAFLLLLRIIFPIRAAAFSKYLVSSTVAFLFNWWLVKMFGMGVYNYLLGFV